jgi:tyrosine-protein phosphatase SIW14
MTRTHENRTWIRARVLTLAPALLLAVSAYAQQPAGVENFHKLNDNLYRGAQPTQEGFTSLAKLGVKTVLDLREFDSRSLEEKRVVEAAGMKYVNVPIQGTNTPSPAVVAKALAVLNAGDSGPVFVHCRRGAVRTGTIVACYRISHDRWEPAKALREAKDLGMAWYTSGMQHFIGSYRAPVQNASAADTTSPSAN